MSSPLASPDQREAETAALRLIEHPAIRAAREAARASLLADPVAATPDGRLGLDRALDQWVLALVMRIVNADPARPRIVWNVYNAPRHWFGHTYQGAAVAIDNPDNSNREIPIDPAASYTIHGRTGPDPTQLTLEMVTDFEGYAGIGRTLCALTSQSLAIAPDGSFTVTVDARPAEGRPNHMRSEPSATPGGQVWIFARDSMADWRHTITTLRVERTAGPAPPPPRTEQAIVADIAAAMPGWIAFWRGFKDSFLGPPEPNRLVGPIGRPGGWGFLYGGRFRLTDDDAILVTTVDGGANYTGVQIADPWTISPDPTLRLASLNRAQSGPNPDGTTTYAIATRDPGLHNWIDTAGLHEGWMLLRWQGVPPGTDPASLVRSVATVKLDALQAAVPHGTPMADLASRADQIARRSAEHARRFSTSSQADAGPLMQAPPSNVPT